MTKQTTYWDSAGGKRGLLWQSLRDLAEYKHLVWGMAQANFASKHRQTLLGSAWTLLKPILMVLVYVLVLGKIMRISTSGVPALAFFLVGNTLWQLFTEMFGTLSYTVTGNLSVWSKIYYPRIAAAAANTVYVGLLYAGQLLIMAIILAYFYYQGTVPFYAGRLPWALLSLLIMAGIGLGAGLFMSTLTARFADFNMISNILLRVLFFATPILYTQQNIPTGWQWLAWINPFTACFELFRYALLGMDFPPVGMVLIAAATAILLVVLGLRQYVRRTIYLMEDA